MNVDYQQKKSEFAGMNLIVTLPPKAEQDILVEGWIDMMLGATSFDAFQSLVNQRLKAGFSIHGITCLLLHDSTTSALQKRLNRSGKNPNVNLEAAFHKPIGLN